MVRADYPAGDSSVAVERGLKLARQVNETRPTTFHRPNHQPIDMVQLYPTGDYSVLEERKLDPRQSTAQIDTVQINDYLFGFGPRGTGAEISKVSWVQRAAARVQFPYDWRWAQVVLIDTPGFDDTNVSDADILELIATFLASTYQHGKKLAGVLYLHRISDVRMGGIATRNFKMFRQLCGEKTLKNVVIVTTMWSKVTPNEGVARERELKSDELFFKPVLDKKAQLVRHDNTPETARAILSLLVQNEPLPLRIQSELVDEGAKSIADTAAGGELDRELKKQMEKHKEEMVQLEAEMKEAIRTKDEETRQELEEGKQKLEKQMKEAKDDAQKLALDFAARNEALVKKMEEERRAAEKKAVEEREELLRRLGEERRAADKEAAKQRDELLRQMGEERAADKEAARQRQEEVSELHRAYRDQLISAANDKEARLREAERKLGKATDDSQNMMLELMKQMREERRAAGEEAARQREQIYNLQRAVDNQDSDSGCNIM
ncbi:hypothetical protein L218DRAFT_989712 [Marasmius fiardii PR-910]|nr:hypothetical protein L218DRAFT_989712 [Marasmius fiardii PR-910]